MPKRCRNSPEKRVFGASALSGYGFGGYACDAEKKLKSENVFDDFF